MAKLTECATHLGDAFRPRSALLRAARVAETQLLDFLLWMLGLVTPEVLIGWEGLGRTLYGTGTVTTETSRQQDIAGTKGHTGAGITIKLTRLKVITAKGPVIGLGGVAIARRGDQSPNLKGARAAMLGEAR